MGRRRSIGALCTAVVTALALATPASAAPAPTPPPAGVSVQRGEAYRLNALAAAQQAQLAQAEKEINRLAAVVAQARAKAAIARQQEQNALAAALDQTRSVNQASAQLQQQGERLGRWAADAYTSGLADPQLRNLQAILNSGDMDQALTRISLLNAVGQVQDQQVDSARTSEAAQRHAMTQADRFKDAALEASAEAQAQETVVTNSMAAQQAKVNEMARLLRDAQARASAADRAAWAAEDAARNAASTTYGNNDSNANNGGDKPVDGTNRANGPTGECKGGDTWSFGNGRIPVQNLCPVFAAPNQYLRADAAYEFRLMSQAYLQQFGTPICVTEGYRTYEEQVRLKITKPGLSATPGYSNHGWGVAADLCGGIGQFGTAQHAWMKANAGQFGWYHPSWAEPNGRLPEAWHWQFRWNS